MLCFGQTFSATNMTALEMILFLLQFLSTGALDLPPPLSFHPLLVQFTAFSIIALGSLLLSHPFCLPITTLS